MARPKASEPKREPRVLMRVPISFRSYALNTAHAAGMEATMYLEKARLVYEG
jgi:hypothetical protein